MTLSTHPTNTHPHNVTGDPSQDHAVIGEIITKNQGLEGPLLPILHDLQEAFGFVPRAAHVPICDALNISGAELAGVISFYHDFRAAPAGKHVLKICRAEACQSVGAAAMADALLQKLGLDWHSTTPDGTVTIEPVYCLGLCACAPAAMMDDKVLGRVDAASLEKLIEETKS